MMGWGRLFFMVNFIKSNTLISCSIYQKYIWTMPVISAFLLLVCSFQIHSGLMKWVMGYRDETLKFLAMLKDFDTKIFPMF